MNKIETLPYGVFYKGNQYFLSLHVNFRGNLVIQYKSFDGKENILSYAVERDSEPYEPVSIESSNGMLNENIGNEKTLDKCIDRIRERIDGLNLAVNYV